MKLVTFSIFLILLTFVTACTTQEKFMDKDEFDNNVMMQKEVTQDKQIMDESNNVMTAKNMESENASQQMMDDEKGMQDNAMMKYNGKVLAGKQSPYLEFNKEDYDLAIAQNKKILLYFYADWCPSCIAEQPKAIDAFDMMQASDAIGFRVNYKDSQTDENEKNLAKQFGITYQHTKIIIDSTGKQAIKSLENWDAARYLEEIGNLA